MKKILVTFLAIGICYATELPINFSELKWGESYTSINKSLLAKGFTFVGKDKVYDMQVYKYIGIFFSEKTSVTVCFLNNKLVKVLVNLITEDEQCINIFVKVLNGLKEKYGHHDDYTYEFQSPYYSGDGYETQAIALGRAKIMCFWRNEESGEFLTTKINKDLTVSIIYESKLFAEYAEKQQQKEKDQF